MLCAKYSLNIIGVRNYYPLGEMNLPLVRREFEGSCNMMQMPVPHCDSCGLPINPEAGENCPRCGYPVSPPIEEHFLEAAIRDLQ